MDPTLNAFAFNDDRLDGSYIVVARDSSDESHLSSAPSRTRANEVLGGTESVPRQLASEVPGSVSAPYAHNWDPSLPGNRLSISGKHLIDSWGRVCLPRGVNLSGASKTPVNHNHKTFPSDYANVTFVGRPFSLEAAPEHFARLRRWGLTFVRFLVTWEALEHAGPGLYDTEYIQYLQALLRLMKDFGIVCVVSMHQDVWSRFSGGSGAPAWTLEAVGFNLDALEETGAAYLGGVREPGIEKVKGRWPTGYLKLASSTMWTCFWAGDVFAPNLVVTTAEGEQLGVQTFLQSRFLSCFENLAKELDSISSILGFECLNEPHGGYINLPSLHEFNYYTELHFHDTPSALQSFALGAGHQVEIPHYVRSFPFPTRISHHVQCNPSKKSVWRAGGPSKGHCIWEMHGVWGWDESKQKPVALRENYFTRHPITGNKIDWYEDFWYPFVNKWASRVQMVSDPSRLMFVEGIPNEFCPPSWEAQHRPKNMVFAPHWYDLDSLFSKAFGNFTVNVQGLSRGMFLPRAMYWGSSGARANYRLQMSTLVGAAHASLEESTPVIIGECGIPMDMNNAEAFRSGDFNWQERAMDALMYALETTLVSFTLWNYNPDNNDIQGDSWNGENFSWFSQARARTSKKTSLSQDDTSLDVGARLLYVLVRPYPAKVAGTPLSFDYESATGSFSFRYKSSERTGSVQTASLVVDAEAGPNRGATTEFFIPSSFAHGRKMIVECLREGTTSTYDPAVQTLYVVTADKGSDIIHTVNISFDPPLGKKPRSFNAPLSWLTAIVLLIALLVYRMSPFSSA